MTPPRLPRPPSAFLQAPDGVNVGLSLRHFSPVARGRRDTRRPAAALQHHPVCRSPPTAAPRRRRRGRLRRALVVGTAHTTARAHRRHEAAWRLGRLNVARAALVDAGARTGRRAQALQLVLERGDQRVLILARRRHGVAHPLSGHHHRRHVGLRPLHLRLCCFDRRRGEVQRIHRRAEHLAVERLVYGLQRIGHAVGPDRVDNRVRLRARDVTDEVGVAELPPLLHGRLHRMRWLPAAYCALNVRGLQVKVVVLRRGRQLLRHRLLEVVRHVHAVDRVLRPERVGHAGGLESRVRNIAHVKLVRDRVRLVPHALVARLPARLRALDVVDGRVALLKAEEGLGLGARNVRHVVRVANELGRRVRRRLVRRQLVLGHERVHFALGHERVRRRHSPINIVHPHGVVAHVRLAVERV
mmetsp:Transcript_2181/g.4851  ORF Transcript_2181/g.4851 Transcript_2181/m.4851 type:complete len:414 (+) Transcript_2181:210-1451(+)